VRSVLGRYLEHSRIFAFGSGRHAPVRYYIGSADMMPRNLHRRVEVLAPVEDPDLAARLQEILDVNLSPDFRAWRLTADGDWVLEGGGGDVQAHLAELAAARAGASRSG
jgi:polyphosphate kinase